MNNQSKNVRKQSVNTCQLDDEEEQTIFEARQLVQQSHDITDFQRKVYLALLDVRRGCTISYAKLGKKIGCGSAQAIGQALKHNPFAPEVPCHRVLRTDGTIGGYCGKTSGELISRKIALLANEGIKVKI